MAEIALGPRKRGNRTSEVLVRHFSDNPTTQDLARGVA